MSLSGSFPKPVLAGCTLALLVGILGLPAIAQEGAVAYRGATLETVSKPGRIDRGVIVVRDGKIETVGGVDEVEIPDDARVIDADGQTIMPGIVEPTYPLAGGEGGGRVVIVGGQRVLVSSGGPTRAPSFVRVVDQFYPYEARFKAQLRSGITYLNLVSGDFGQAAVARCLLDDPEKLVLESSGRLYFTLSNSTPSLDALRNGLKSGKPSDRGGRPGTPPAGASGAGRPSGGPEGETRPGAPPSAPSSASPTQPLWQAVVEGKAPLMLGASSAAAISYAMEILKEYEAAEVILIASADDLQLTLDQLSPRVKTVVLEPGLSAAKNSADWVNVARQVHQSGRTIAFRQGDATGNQDAPLFPLAMLVRTGLPRSAALEAMTINPARAIGQESQLGSLEKGKAATLLFFEGDPLDPYSQLRKVQIEGKTVYEN